MRRYCRHNGLGRMLTFTYAHECDGVDRLALDFRNWRRRLLRQDWATFDSFPYLWVAEWGKRTGRLHAHVAVGSWWDALGCVEVCERCATANRAKRGGLAPAGSACVGCTWGHGFVGRPFDGDQDAAAVAHYAAKYVGKGIGDLGIPGRQAYRVAEGFQPEPVRLSDLTWEQARELVPELLGVDLERTDAFPLHERIDGWAAAPTWSVTVRRETDDVR